MSSFALFRLPYTTACTLVEQVQGDPLELPACAALGDSEGFVMAPFAPSASVPVLLIRPDRVERIEQDADDAAWQSLVGHIVFDLPSLRSAAVVHPRSDYHIDFANFHTHLLSGDFQKLVLSRSIDLPRKDSDSPFALFRKACRCYPRMFISLVYTPKSGLWLAATPETLLEGGGGQWRTVALAGTTAYSDKVFWSDKNIEEQRYVATYITRTLEHFTSDFSEDGPHTVRAGHLAHLRSDFRFVLPPSAQVGALLQALHPTPAVCGLPKLPAFRFIRQYEHHDRSYYSGFMGPMLIGGETRLFVTLRCMQIQVGSYRLYAGGGLLRDSDEEQEWQETETKLDTMRRVIGAGE